MNGDDSGIQSHECVFGFTQIAILSISSSVIASFDRSYNFVVRGDSWAAIF